SASRICPPDAPQLVSLQPIKTDRTARDAELEPRLPWVEIDRQGHISQAVGGEDLEAGSVRVDDQPLRPADEWCRSRPVGDADLLAGSIEADVHASNPECE